MVTGLPRGAPTKGMRIATPCATESQFVEAFHRYCEDNSFFVSTLTMRPVGLESAFSVDLTDGRPMLRGYGVVLDAWPTAQNRFGRPGIQIGIHKLTSSSQAVFEQLLIARALASEKRESKAVARTMTRQLWAISAPPLPTTPQPPPEPRPQKLPGLVRTATPPKGVATPVVPASPIVAVAAVDPHEATFDNESPTVTASPPDVAMFAAASAALGDGVTFDTPTATATPMYAAAALNDPAARRSDRAPVVPMSDPPPRPAENLDDGWDDRKEPAAVVVAPIRVPDDGDEPEPLSPIEFAPPPPIAIEAPPPPRAWWKNVRVALVFVGGLAMGFSISWLVRSPAEVAAPPQPTNVAPVHAATAPPPVTPQPPPPIAPRAPVPPAPVVAPVAKPAPAPTHVAKPAPPKPVVRRPVARPKPPSTVAKPPKCVGLSCV